MQLHHAHPLCMDEYSTLYNISKSLDMKSLSKWRKFCLLNTGFIAAAIGTHLYLIHDSYIWYAVILWIMTFFLYITE